VRTSGLLVLFLIVGASRAAAGEPSAAELRRRAESQLRGRATQWCEARQAAVSKCPSCDGKGKVSYESTDKVPTLKYRDCSRCVRGFKVKADRARVAYFDVYTPQWRENDQNIRTSQAWIDGLAKDPGPAVLKSYTIEDVEIVGERHGITRIRETRETEQIAPLTYRWVLLDDAKTRGSVWYQWHSSDGLWGVAPTRVDPNPPPDAKPGATTPVGEPAPADGARKPADGAAPPATPPAPKEPVAFDSDATQALSKSLVEAEIHASLESAEWRGDTAVLMLLPRGAADQAALDEAVALTIAPATRVAMKALEKATAVRLVFLARYRDRLGEVSKRPYETTSMTRDVFAKIHFENLNRVETLDLFTREPHVYRLEGLTLWWKD
jgi:hypothetical protein